VLAATAQDDPRTRPVLLCSAEGGHKSIIWRLSLPESDPRHGTLYIKRIEKFPDDIYEMVQVIKENPGIVRTVVMDSLTDLAWRVEQNMLSTPNRERKTEGALGWSEWRIFNTRVRNLITMFRDLNVNVIATALETEKDGNYGPIVGGKTTAEYLPGFFDSVHRLAIVSEPAPSEDGKSMVLVQRRLLTLTADSKFVAKDRNDPLGVLPRTMYDPTVPLLLQRVEQGIRAAAQQNAITAKKEATKA
jgi:hypothetical protein